MAQGSSQTPTFRWLGTWLLVIGCGSSAATAGAQANGGASASGGAQAAAGPNLDVTAGACPDAGAPRGDASVCVVAQARSFTREIIPLFNGCAGEVCHSFSAGGIAQQVGLPSVECCSERLLIEPGHPERSYVLQKLRGTELCGGARMPLDHPAFTASDLQAVSDWICRGATSLP